MYQGGKGAGRVRVHFSLADFAYRGACFCMDSPLETSFYARIGIGPPKFSFGSEACLESYRTLGYNSNIAVIYITGDHDYLEARLIRMYPGGKKAFTLIELLVVISIIALLAAILFPVFQRARESARRSSCQSNQKQIGIGIMQYVQDYDDRVPLVSVAGPPNAATPWDTSMGPYGWADSLQPYLQSVQIYECPSDKYPHQKVSAPNAASYTDYFYNSQMCESAPTLLNRGKHLAQLTTASNTILLGEWTGAPYGYSRLNWPGGNLAYVGLNHTQWIPFVGTSTTLTEIGPVNYSNCQRHFEGSNYLFADGHVKWIQGDTPNSTTKISVAGSPTSGWTFRTS